MKKFDYNTLFVPTYKREGAPVVKGKGVYLYDSDNTAFLDFGSGIAVNALGHSSPQLLKALREQGEKVLHTSNLYFSKPQIDLARQLLKSSFGDRIFFCNSGTEANEAAIKFARKKAKQVSPDKFHVLSFYDGFHGRTYGALSATAQGKFHSGFEPMLQGFHYAKLNDISGCKKLLKAHPFAAIIVEPLQGEGGIISATTEFLQFLRDFSDKNAITLIFDEIQCGMGRTGTLWNYQQHGVIPDIMTLAKPVGGGLPLGVVICKESVAEAIHPGDHGTTFGGNPLACALGTEVLKAVGKKKFLKDVTLNGEYLKRKLSELQTKYPVITAVRGSGLLLGVEFKEDPQGVIALCKDKKLLLVKAGHNTIRFMPPLIVTRKEIDKALGIFEKALKAHI